MIVATSRASRFADKDVGVDLHTVNICVGDKELLVDAHLQFKTGVHYGLLGRNGVGKSILLHCLATGLLLSPELRTELKIMLIRQTLEEDDDVPSTEGQKKTVMEELETTPFGLDFILSEREKWALKAQQQSGARGKYARQMLIQFESITPEDEEDISLQASYHDDPPPSVIVSVAKSLQISEAMLKRPYDELSGGWKMRVQLAKALIYKPDLLLLDEPTNHLDIAGVAKLERLLKSEKFEGVTMVLISHNRSFLNSVTQETILFKNQKLEYFQGNYDHYLQVVEEKELFAERMQNALDRKKASMKQSIDKNAKLSRKQGDDKRMKQVASKKYKLEERVGLERNAKGHRFKLNRDRAGYHFSLLSDVEHVEDENKQTVLRFALPTPDLPRSNGPLLVVEDVSFERKHSVTGRRLFALEGITFDVSAGQRVAILGANGEGKSTLLNLLVDGSSLVPTRGSIQRRVSNIGYFRQEVVSELGKVSESPIEYLVHQHQSAKTQKECWKHLGSFGLGASQIATNTEINHLSGGQRVAFAFANLTCTSPPPSILLLDEPNSHLDLDALKALEESLVTFEGGVVFVSHDLSFIKNVATDAYWISSGKLRKIELDEVERLAVVGTTPTKK